MQARVSKWGKSLAIRLPQAAVKSLRVQAGDQVELSIKGDRLEIRAAQPRYRLADLISEITPDNQPEPMDFLRSVRKPCERHPEVGDLVWVNFNPQAGHEQRGAGGLW